MIIIDYEYWLLLLIRIVDWLWLLIDDDDLLRLLTIDYWWLNNDWLLPANVDCGFNRAYKHIGIWPSNQTCADPTINIWVVPVVMRSWGIELPSAVHKHGLLENPPAKIRGFSQPQISIYRGFSFATFDYQRLSHNVDVSKNGTTFHLIVDHGKSLEMATGCSPFPLQKIKRALKIIQDPT